VSGYRTWKQCSNHNNIREQWDLPKVKVFYSKFGILNFHMAVYLGDILAIVLSCGGHWLPMCSMRCEQAGRMPLTYFVHVRLSAAETAIALPRGELHNISATSELFWESGISKIIVHLHVVQYLKRDFNWRWVSSIWYCQLRRPARKKSLLVMRHSNRVQRSKTK